MQDRAFSPESAEEVIELLDIVEPSDDMSCSDAAEEVTAEITADEALDLTDIMTADIEGDGGVPSESDNVDADSAQPEPVIEPCAVDSDAIENESEEEQGMPGETSDESDVISAEEDVPAVMSVCVSSGPDASADLEACLALAAEVDERVRELEERQNAELNVLRERLAASEKLCAELTAEVESLQQQLAQCSSNFLEDPSLRLALEEMVSRMIELQMPVVPQDKVVEENISLVEEAETSVPESEWGDESGEPEEEAESAPAEEENASRQVIIETIEELAQHVGELEARVADWELRCEQEAALAAARVIREEIAALKAGAARLGR